MWKRTKSVPRPAPESEDRPEIPPEIPLDREGARSSRSSRTTTAGKTHFSHSNERVTKE